MNDNDTFTGAPDSSRLENLTYLHLANGFDRVVGRSSGQANDRAFIRDTSAARTDCTFAILMAMTN